MSRSPCFAVLASVLPTFGVAAQVPTTTARIGMLCPVRCSGPGHAAFEDQLRRLGWVEGHSLTVERRALEGRYECLSELVAEVVGSRPDLIVGPGVPIARALKDATSEIPIAFSFVANPVQMSLVQSLARQGQRNVTGVAAIAPGTFLAKQFEILREPLPQAQRVAGLVNPANDDHRLARAREVPMASQRGLQADVIELHTPEDVPTAVKKAGALGAEGLLDLGDAILNTPPNGIPDLLARTAFPALYSNRGPGLDGGLISYTPDMIALARRHAYYPNRILRGASPTAMPVEHPIQYKLVVNLKTARALGLTVPPSLLSQADEVIE